MLSQFTFGIPLRGEAAALVYGPLQKKVTLSPPALQKSAVAGETSKS